MRKDQIRRWTVFIISIILIILMTLSMGGRGKITIAEKVFGGGISFFQKISSNISLFVSEKTAPFRDAFRLKEKNEKLEKENKELRNELIEAKLSKEEYKDLSELKEVLNYVKSDKNQKYLTANVISKDTGNWYNMFTIDAGENYNITKNSVVMNDEGLIGLVYEVGYNYSKVISIIDNKSSISCEVISGDKVYSGIVRGTFKENLEGELFDPNSIVSEGDIVVSSGQGIYPKGILIGEITEFTNQEDILFNKISVNVAVDFRNINRVFVVIKENEDE